MPPEPFADYTSASYGPPAEVRRDDTIARKPHGWDDAERMVRRSGHAPSSWDADAMTVDVIAATSAPVQRSDRRGTYLERLDMATLDMSNIVGLPVRDDHAPGGTRTTVGVVQDAHTEGDRLLAKLRLTAADDAKPVVQRVADGTVSGISIGYVVRGWTEGIEGGQRVLRPSAWRLTEISITPQPADAASRVRSTHAERTPTMEPEDITVPARDDATPTRSAEIRQLCRSRNVSTDEADAFVDGDATADEVRLALFDRPARRSLPVIRAAQAQHDDPTVIVRHQSEAVAYRMGGGELTDGSRRFAETTLQEMADAALLRSGISIGTLSRAERLQRAVHTTSDFPTVLANATGKTAMQAYAEARSALMAACRKIVLRDFKESTAVGLTSAGTLEEIAESGEFTAVSRGERAEGIRLKTYGRRIDMSRQLLVNDDLGVFGDTVAEFGRMAARTEGEHLADLLSGATLLRDGLPLFDASRGNIGTDLATGPTSNGLAEAREALRKRRDPGGALLNLRPAFLIVAAEEETAAEEVLTALNPANVADVNVFAGNRLTLIVEPRLPAGSYYVAAAPSQLACLRYAYLAGAEGPQVQRHEMWDTLGTSWRCYLDWGTGALDWRGLHRVDLA